MADQRPCRSRVRAKPSTTDDPELGGPERPHHRAWSGGGRERDRRRADHPPVDDRGEVLDGRRRGLDRSGAKALGGVGAVGDAEDAPDRSPTWWIARVEVDVDQVLEIVERDRPDLDVAAGAAAPHVLVVDLGPLQPAAEVDVDRLPLGERVERGVAGLAVAVAGLLPAAERQVRLGAGRARR